MKTQSLNIALTALMLSCLAAAAQTSSKLPSQITTLDGKTYQGVAEQAEAVYPDGIVVQYQPEQAGQPIPGAIASAKLEFRNLPENVQKLFPHDAKSAAEFETQQAQATGQMLQAQAAEERAITRYINLAELHRSLAGDADSSYSVAMDGNGKVSAQGYTRPVPAETITNVTIPTFTYIARRNGLVTDYVPVQNAPSTVVLTK
jgi:hypothetical protein